MYKVIYASGTLIFAVLFIITAVRKSKVLAVVSGVFYALYTVSNTYAVQIISFIVGMSGEDEFIAFATYVNSTYYAGFILTAGAVMILSYCAAYAGNTESTFEKRNEIFESRGEETL